MTALRLGVNVDHVATVRNARGGAFPIPCARRSSPSRPAPTGSPPICARTAATSTTTTCAGSRPRSASRSISRWRRPRRCSTSRCSIRPHACCLVPEKRTERTTEGGLDVVGGFKALKPFVAELGKAGIRVSMFIEPSSEALKASADLGAPVVELHTGAWCDALAHRDAARADYEFGRLRVAAAQIRRRSGSNATPATGSTTTRRAYRQPAADRRAQHRPFPGRRGDLRRPRGNGEAHARGDGRGARRRGARGDRRGRQRPLRHPAHRADARAPRRPVRRSAASPRSSGAGPTRGRGARPPTPSGSPPRRPAPRRSGRA